MKKKKVYLILCPSRAANSSSGTNVFDQQYESKILIGNQQSSLELFLIKILFLLVETFDLNKYL